VVSVIAFDFRRISLSYIPTLWILSDNLSLSISHYLFFLKLWVLQLIGRGNWKRLTKTWSHRELIQEQVKCLALARGRTQNQTDIETQSRGQKQRQTETEKERERDRDKYRTEKWSWVILIW